MKKKLTCLLLCVLLAASQVQAAAPEQAQQPTQQQTAAEQQMAEMEAELELEQLPLYDRYIVKLKPTNSLAAANTTLDAAVEAAIPAAKQAANTQVQAVLDEKQMDETEAFNLAETPSYTVDEQSAELLTVTLTEKVDAAAFTAELAGNAQIEYIQSDYTLELASDVVLDLDLSELTPAGTPVPAATETPEATGTPEIGVEITPEQTTAPEATLDPEVQPTPETEPTPDATPTPTDAPIVAVIDSGIDVAHHGLTTQMLPGYDFVNNTELVYDSGKKDEYYHGTHVAGVIAQDAPVKVMDSTGMAALADVVEFSANNEISMAKTADGRIWTWGMNRYGEFGNSVSGRNSALPVEFGVEEEAFYTSINETFSIETGKIFNLYANVNNVFNIEEAVFTLIYDETELSVKDLCAQTYEIETTSIAQNAPVSIIKAELGEIEFQYRGNTQNGWFSGVVNIIQFEGLKAGDTEIEFRIGR